MATGPQTFPAAAHSPASHPEFLPSHSPPSATSKQSSGRMLLPQEATPHPFPLSLVQGQPPAPGHPHGSAGVDTGASQGSVSSQWKHDGNKCWLRVRTNARQPHGQEPQASLTRGVDAPCPAGLGLCADSSLHKHRGMQGTPDHRRWGWARRRPRELGEI